MHAVSASRRRRTRAATGFSIKPVAVLLCAALIVRFLYDGEILSRFSQAVSGWTSSESFAVLAIRGAGAPGAPDEGSGWAAALLSSQSSMFDNINMAYIGEDRPEDADAEPAVENDAPESTVEGVISPPEPVLFFPNSFWYPPTGEPVVESAAERIEQPEQPDQSDVSEVDGRSLPVPGPDDPGAKRVLEITLTAPEGTPKGVYINNKTAYSVSAQDMLLKKSALKVSDPKNPQVLIIHTHGSESFLPDERDYYIPTDIERTEDTRYNVVRLGDEMAKGLETLGLNVLHDREIYDSPSYNGSYGRSLASIQKYIKEYPSIQVVIDIHRDAITAADGSMYKAVSQTDRGKAAQMMIVVGTNGSGLTHPNWKQNLAFACDLDKVVLDAYPTLMRPVSLRKERFNQHATTGSIILEVGTAGNSLSEALLSIELFCETAGARLAEQLLA